MRALFKLNPNKSPGPDGLTSRFYSCSWPILGQEVTTSIRRFFSTSNMPSGMNSTILTLIPKFPGATVIKDYRPISCCNTVYKVISKLLVAKIKPLLPSIILPNQSAFIKGRLLLENVLLASEIVSGDHRNKGLKRLTLKVDIAKAFDSLSWDFVTACLSALDLHPHFISWVRECYSTHAYSVGINSSLHGYFRGTRGIRQGDPLIPYLFGLAMNVLSHKLNAAADSGLIGYHPRCKDSKLTHLCFADDLLIFSDGSPASLQGIIAVLSEFQRLSGLAISPQKSCFFPAGLSPAEITELVAISGIPQGFLPMQYLGLPLSTKKLSLLNCEPLLQKIKSKISLWTAKYLSLAGRLQLLSSVISGIINFWCAAFILPKACINQINSMCSAYLWKGSLDGRHVARVAWETITSPKAEGGLGLKDIRIWNKSCTFKLLWMLFFKTDSVWVAWIQDNVIKDSCLWELKEKQTHTWLFKKLLRLRAEATQWIRIIPGNGYSISFWRSPWSSFGPLLQRIGSHGPRQTGIPLSSSLSTLWNGSSWILSPARSLMMEQVHIHLSTITLSSSPDHPVWNSTGIGANNNNKFIISEIYDSIRESRPKVPWNKAVWFSNGIPKHKTMTWLFLLNRCPTPDRLLSWDLQTDPSCLLCKNHPESRNHIFFGCSFMRSIWRPLSTKIGLTSPSESWEDTTRAIINFTGSTHHIFLIRIAWQLVIYETWRERNHRLHRGSFKGPDSLISQIEKTITNRISSFREENPQDSSNCGSLCHSRRSFLMTSSSLLRSSRRKRETDAFSECYYYMGHFFWAFECHN